MDRTLKSLHVKLDSTMQTLTQGAIAQLLVKVIFHSDNPISEIELLNTYKKVVKQNYNEESIKAILNGLVQSDDIKFDNNQYRISTSKRRKIQASKDESKNRFENIVDKYFSPSYSDKEVIGECLNNSLIYFFESYSNEWISDINYREKYVINSKINIIETIIRRIENNKQLNNEDKKVFPSKFIEFITTQNDVDIDGILWEFGTSAFAAKLIKTSNSSTPMAIDVFSNSQCILDTNILMNIGLESGRYYSALKSIEKAFVKLGISVGILNITKEEYEHTITHIKDKSINLLSKGYPLDVLKESSDQYLQTAISRGCSLEEDFERFFEDLETVPDFFDENLPIEIINHDQTLAETILSSQQDAKKLQLLNDIYYNYWGRYKREKVLMHDVGMLAGVEYLRCSKKTFILSQEVSVNCYSKQRPLAFDLPLSIKLETLMNVLSITNAGVDVEDSYINLFATIVRSGLTPHKGTFKPEDLQYMVDKDMQITQLSSDDTIRIARNIHALRVQGEPEDKISLEFTRAITGVKIKIKDDLDKVIVDRDNEKREKSRIQERYDSTNKVLKNMIANEAESEYQDEMNHIYRKLLWSIIPLLIATGPLYLIIKAHIENVNVFWNIIICFAVNIVSNYLWYALGIIPKIREYKRCKKQIISDKISAKFRAKLGDK